VLNAACGLTPFVVDPEAGTIRRRLNVHPAERWDPSLLFARIRGERGNSAPQALVERATDTTADGRRTIGRSSRIAIDTSCAPPLMSAAVFPRDIRPTRPAADPEIVRRIGWILLAVSGGTDDRFHVMREFGDLFSIERAIALSSSNPPPKQLRAKAKVLVAEADEDRHLIELLQHGRCPAAVWDA
jgi:hypothetical protein